MTISKFGKHLNILKYIWNNVPSELEIPQTIHLSDFI